MFVKNLNEAKPMGDPVITKIGQNFIVESQLYTKRNEKYCDIVLINIQNEKKSFIGRFKEPKSTVKILYNDGKILVYNDEFNMEKRKDVITNVLALYSIIDDVVYAETEENALKIFDESIDSSYLQNGSKSIIKTDVKRMELKKLKRF